MPSDRTRFLARLRGPLLAAALVLLAACAARPPSPAEVAAKRFEPVEGKAVIYVVRDRLDFTEEPTTITLDGHMMGTTYRGTFSRWVVEPGQHRIAGFAGDAGSMTIDARPGEIHYVEQATWRILGWVQSRFHLLPERAGQAAVRRAELIASWPAS